MASECCVGLGACVNVSHIPTFGLQSELVWCQQRQPVPGACSANKHARLHYRSQEGYLHGLPQCVLVQSVCECLEYCCHSRMPTRIPVTLPETYQVHIHIICTAVRDFLVLRACTRHLLHLLHYTLFWGGLELKSLVCATHIHTLQQ